MLVPQRCLVLEESSCGGREAFITLKFVTLMVSQHRCCVTSQRSKYRKTAVKLVIRNVTFVTNAHRVNGEEELLDLWDLFLLQFFLIA